MVVVCKKVLPTQFVYIRTIVFIVYSGCKVKDIFAF